MMSTYQLAIQTVETAEIIEYPATEVARFTDAVITLKALLKIKTMHNLSDTFMTEAGSLAMSLVEYVENHPLRKITEAVQWAAYAAERRSSYAAEYVILSGMAKLFAAYGACPPDEYGISEKAKNLRRFY